MHAASRLRQVPAMLAGDGPPNLPCGDRPRVVDPGTTRAARYFKIFPIAIGADRRPMFVGPAIWGALCHA